MSEPRPSLLAWLALAIVRFYQRFLSKPLHLIPGSGCRFHPTCSCYTATALARFGGVLKSFNVALVFVLPPSLAELESRLRKRATDDAEVIVDTVGQEPRASVALVLDELVRRGLAARDS